MKHQLGIFVKEPVAGKVKTRLTPPLSSDQAAELYRVALHETVERMQAASCTLVLFYAGDEEYFRRAFPSLQRIRQSEGDLGCRMTAAFNWMFGNRAVASALIGSDSPDLPLTQIDAAFAALKQNDVVTIPASDGGYILIGSRHSHPGIFRGIDWSTEKVLSQTRRQARAHGLDFAELGEWEDVDDIISLQRLLLRSPDSATAAHARHHLGGLIGVQSESLTF